MLFLPRQVGDAPLPPAHPRNGSDLSTKITEEELVLKPRVVEFKVSGPGTCTQTTQGDKLRHTTQVKGWGYWSFLGMEIQFPINLLPSFSTESSPL